VVEVAHQLFEEELRVLLDFAVDLLDAVLHLVVEGLQQFSLGACIVGI
jgi:hypothetical protein